MNTDLRGNYTGKKHTQFLNYKIQTFKWDISLCTLLLCLLGLKPKCIELLVLDDDHDSELGIKEQVDEAQISTIQKSQS